MLTQYDQPLQRVNEVLDIPDPGEPPDELMTLSGTDRPPSIRVKDLVFSYPGASGPVIDGLSFEIESGQCVGVVGASGSGKSTLARLLIGEWPADGGEIALDEISIDEWHLWHRRELISYLPAEQGFLKASLDDNIAFGRGQLGGERLAEAISACGLTEKREQLGNAPLESVSEHLSTGEQRRVGVARMLCGDEPVRIFDEPIANLDRRNMVGVAEAIERSTAGRTVLIITHDPEFFRTDTILFLVDGKLFARGRHEDLLCDVPEYAELLQVHRQERQEAWQSIEENSEPGDLP